ncbi:hypothetical protein M1567_00060 [Candidatus Marsarchaeota archaeon]|nr:hypothetical protein [Candidatus Marsarchaeota archaeon]
MPVDPDDMLIFRMRHMTPNIGASPQQISQATQPQKQNIQPQEKAQPSAQVQPKAAAQAPQPKPKFVPPAASRRPAANFREQEEAPVFVSPKVSSAVIEEAVEAAGGDISQMSAKKKSKTRSEEESEEAAEGLSCVWHPWRPAYAICNYCHRPFCFEDIVEQNGHYYCLEDIDKVGTESAISEMSGKLNYINVGAISGIMYVAVFLLFILFASTQLSNVISYSNSVGFFTFLSSAKLEEILLVLESAAALLAFVAGFLTMLHAKAAVAVGPIAALLTMIMFAYGFAAFGILYAAVIAAVALMALVMQAYSLVGSRSAEAVEEKSANEQDNTEVQFANVGRF